MARYRGTQQILNRYRGDTQILKRYRGSQIVYSGVGKMYMLGTTNRSFYEIDTETGVATKISDLPTDPNHQGFLTTIGGVLYGTYGNINRLYTIDPDTGKFTRVGFATDFGLSNYGGDTGLAAIGDVLYLAAFEDDPDSDTTKNILCTVNRNTGVATKITDITGFTPGGGDYSFLRLAAIDNVMYMVVNSNGGLYTLNTTSGEATRVGSAFLFNVSETNMLGLTSIGSTLYGIGGATDRLYTIDKNTGIASRVDSATNYGVSEDFAIGLAYIPKLPDLGTMYMVGSDNEALYRVNLESGVAVRVSSVTNFGAANITGPQGLAALNGVLYLIDGSTNALYTVDTSSGEATRVGSANRFGVNESAPRAISALGNNLYFVGSRTDRLYTLNPSTGVASRVGTVDNFGVGVRSPVGLATLNNTLYLIGDDALYTLNERTGVARRVGTASLFGEAIVTNPSSLSSDGTTLYMTEEGPISDFYKVNHTNGVAEKIGGSINFGVDESSPKGLAYIPN